MTWRKLKPYQRKIHDGCAHAQSVERVAAMDKEVYDDLLQVLREADADLAGVHDRYDLSLEPDETDVRATAETRKHINRVYEALTGQDLKGDSSDSIG